MGTQSASRLRTAIFLTEGIITTIKTAIATQITIVASAENPAKRAAIQSKTNPALSTMGFGII